MPTLPKRQRLRRTFLFSLLLLFPLTFNYYSPALPIMGAAERVACFSLFFWLTWCVASLFLGRAACGYFCPLGGLQEVWDFAVDRPLKRVRFLAALKYVIFASWIAAIALVAFKSGGWKRVDLLYQTENLVSWDSLDKVVIYVGMFGLVMLLCLPLGKRAFCHYLCWWSPLNMAGAKLSHGLKTPCLRLHADADKCVHCQTCDRGCPMSLPVSDLVAEGDMHHTECLLCGTCVDNCREGAIQYAWRAEGGPSRA